VKKIPSVWVRDLSLPGAIYKPEVTPGCEWVLCGVGVATRKWDGTAVLVRNGTVYARFDAKRGKTHPVNFEPCQDPDPNTGHWPGWVPATRPEDKWIREAFARYERLPDGTYEACGPKIGGNPEKLSAHLLYRHGDMVWEDVPRAFEELRAFITPLDLEGFVFHHPDGRMAKATKQGFGLRR